MNSFIRKNLMIVVSIALPLLVILFFAAASVLPGMFATPPAHDLVLSLHDRAAPGTFAFRYNFVIKDGQLKAEFFTTDKSNYQSNPRLFLYEHISGEVSEVNFEIPESSEGYSDGMEIPVPAFAGKHVSGILRAPDGYEFRGHRSGGGFMTELFGGRRNRTDVSIAKGASVQRLRLPTSDYWYNSVRFVGWVTEQGNQHEQ